MDPLIKGTAFSRQQTNAIDTTAGVMVFLIVFKQLGYYILFAPHLGSGDVVAHRAAVLPEIPDHDAPVNPGQGVVLKLGGELLVGSIVFRRDDEAGGVPVDPVDDAGPQLPSDAGEGVPAVVQQGIDQRAVRVAGGRGL